MGAVPFHFMAGGMWVGAYLQVGGAPRLVIHPEVEDPSCCCSHFGSCPAGYPRALWGEEGGDRLEPRL